MRAPSLPVLGFLAFALLLFTGATLALFAMGDAGEQAQVLGALKYAGPIVLAGLPAAAAFLRGETTRNIVQKIDTQTNGGLDARIRAGALDALKDYHTTPATVPAQRTAPKTKAGSK